MRVKNIDQAVAQFGELIIELVMNAAGDQRERFDQALDVRIGAAVWLQQQPPCRSGILPGEVLGHLPDEQQLALIVGKKCLAHIVCYLLLPIR